MNTRLGLMLLPSKWGVLARATYHLGRETEEVCHSFFELRHCSTPREEFNELGILLVRYLGSRFTVGAGMASYRGQHAVDDGRRLEEFGSIASIPIEIGIYSRLPDAVGAGLVFLANLNKEASQVGLTGTFTFGPPRRPS